MADFALDFSESKDAGCRVLAMELLCQAYDLHVHAAPSHVPRCMDDFELLRAADGAGMAGVLVKNHYESTAARAEIANRHAGCRARVFGGVALNWPMGGLNPYAADSALKLGAKIVWLPTRDSANSLLFGDMPGDFFSRSGLTVVDEDGVLLPAVYDIFEVVRKYGAYLATGHISAEESLKICHAGRDVGVNMILTHPEWDRTRVPLETQKQIAAMGVVIEHCWYNITERCVTAAEMARNIRELGAEVCYLSTDRGQEGWEYPPEGMARFLSAMLDQGISARDLFVMTHDIPKQILNL